MSGVGRIADISSNSTMLEGSETSATSEEELQHVLAVVNLDLQDRPDDPELLRIFDIVNLDLQDRARAKLDQARAEQDQGKGTNGDQEREIGKDNTETNDKGATVTTL